MRMRIYRALKHGWQKLTRGWSDEDTWNLDYTLAEWIHPRLIRFQELSNSYPADLSREQWDEYLDDMIYAFAMLKDTDSMWEFDEDEQAAVQHGLELFGKYLRNLWW